MIDNINDIATFYNNGTQQEHRRLEQHQLEYDLTWRYLDQYLPPHGTILEIGAATGRYTVGLAKRGYKVTAVDLSAGLLEEAKKLIAAEGVEAQVQFVVADARDLREVVQKDFDAVLLMGPLYHLIVETDRKLALKEAFDRLRADGIIFSAFLSRMGVLGDLIQRSPHWIEGQAEVQSVLANGKRPDEAPRGGFRGYFAQVSEVIPIHEELGLDRLVVAGVEPAIGADDESYNRLQGVQRQQWLDLLYKISTEPSILGASRHLLYIGQKKA